MEHAIEILDQIVKYLHDGGKDLKSVESALATRLRQEILKVKKEEEEFRTVEGNASGAEYKRRLPVHKDWEDKVQPTRKPFNYCSRPVRQLTDWD